MGDGQWTRTGRLAWPYIQCSESGILPRWHQGPYWSLGRNRTVVGDGQWARASRLAGHIDSIVGVAFSPDGTKILTGSVDGTARLWKTISGRKRATLRSHEGSVNSLSFPPDGSKILTGSHDGTARLWETASGQELAVLRGHGNSVNNLAFSPDGQFAITCYDQGRAYLFKVGGLDMESLQGMYVTMFELGAIRWYPSTFIVLTDTGGPLGRPYFYRLKLEGAQ